MNGCYIYQGRDVKERKQALIKGQTVVVAPHEGFIPSDQWLAVRKRLMTTPKFRGESTAVERAKGHRATNTWLAGKIKCGHCGTTMMYAYNTNKQGVRIGYFRCRKRANTKDCQGPGKMPVVITEAVVHTAMTKRIASFHALSDGNHSVAKTNPKLTALNVELLQTEAEIEALINTLSGASPTLLAYANTKIEQLDAKHQSISQAIANLNINTPSSKHLATITNHLDNWDNASFDDRRIAINGLIDRIDATSESVQVEWKI